MKTSREMLQEAQELLGLTQKELGAYIGVSARTINSWMGPAETRTCPLYVAEAALRMAEADIRGIKNCDWRTSMMRWALITNDGIENLHVYGAKADALREANIQWSRLTKEEREKLQRFEVSLVNVSLVLDEGFGRFSYQETDDGWIDSDPYEVAKNWKE